jgi:aquaporin Z
MNARVYLAELLGTFLFMMIGYTSVAAFHAATTPVPGLLVVPFSFGFGLLAAIFAFGHISGAHFNPAVTVGIVLDGRLPAVQGAGYIIAQVIGAIGAAAVVYATLGQSAVAAGITKPGAGVSDVSALVLETVFTALFVVVILTSSKRAKEFAALAIPLTLVAIHFALATVTGSSVNPARSIGSALVGGDLTGLWIYLVGPIVGGVIGWGVYRGANHPDDPDDQGDLVEAIDTRG